jgi:Tat protein translocase TatB subunit
MDFLGIGLPELLLILVVALIVVGPRRLPEVAAQLARFIREFRKYSSNVTREVTDALEDFEREYKEIKQEWKEVDEGVREDVRAIESEVAGAVQDARAGLDVKPPRGGAAGSRPDGGEPSPRAEGRAERKPPAG